MNWTGATAAHGGMVRPYMKWRSQGVFDKGVRAAAADDVEVFSYCFAELDHRRSKKARGLLEILKGDDFPSPISWIERAASITGSFASQCEGDHALYCVLLEGTARGEASGDPAGYAVYVGETSKSPEKRLTEHLAGGKLASSRVTKWGRCLLPSLYGHLNPQNRDEAKKLEPEVFGALKEAGVPVYGGT